jgi:hypothetical protein
VLGVLVTTTGGTLHMLYRQMAIKWKPPMMSRLPQKEDHEQVDFIFHCIRDDDHDDPNHITMFPGTMKEEDEVDEKAKQFDENDERDE